MARSRAESSQKELPTVNTTTLNSVKDSGQSCRAIWVCVGPTSAWYGGAADGLIHCNSAGSQCTLPKFCSKKQCKSERNQMQ